MIRRVRYTLTLHGLPHSIVDYYKMDASGESLYITAPPKHTRSKTTAADQISPYNERTCYKVGYKNAKTPLERD